MKEKEMGDKDLALTIAAMIGSASFPDNFAAGLEMSTKVYKDMTGDEIDLPIKTSWWQRLKNKEKKI